MILFKPPFAMLRARLYYAWIGFRYDGLRGARYYWKRFGCPSGRT